MKIVIDPAKEKWKKLCQRPHLENAHLHHTVNTILEQIRERGDEAIREYTEKFDQVSLQNLIVSEKEIKAGIESTPPALKKAIELAAQNINTFHTAQKRVMKPIETMPGIWCWQKAVAIERVGIYIPGGSAPLFSTVLMLGIPAKLAGCSEIILCTPPNKNGTINSAILFAATLTGVTTIIKIGGAQAIAAMAYGTPSVPAVNKIFGPGNQYVTKAKQLVNQEGISIDMPAGPSEVVVMADEHANPAFIAADLLSQAEHGADSQVILVTSHHKIIEQTRVELHSQLAKLPRKEIAQQALQNSLGVVFSKLSDQIKFINEYAPEHLIINTDNCEQIADQIINAGSIFLGAYTPESVGDYASGTNHTLPTNGFAKSYSGLSLDSFVKYITLQKLTFDGLNTIGPIVEEMANAENLFAHAQAVQIRRQLM